MFALSRGLAARPRAVWTWQPCASRLRPQRPCRQRLRLRVGPRPASRGSVCAGRLSEGRTASQCSQELAVGARSPERRHGPLQRAPRGHAGPREPAMGRCSQRGLGPWPVAQEIRSACSPAETPGAGTRVTPTSARGARVPERRGAGPRRVLGPRVRRPSARTSRR